MSWPEWSWLQLWLANVRVGFLEFRHQWPISVFIVGALTPVVFRSLVYVMIGRLAAGQAGMAFAFVGCVALALQVPCISNVSDIPVGDVDQRRFAQVRRGGLAPLAQYTGRAVIHMVVGLVMCVAVCLCLGPVVGDWGLMARLVLTLPILVVTAPLVVMFGFAVIAPAIGNEYDDLAHNTAVAWVTLTSGAIFPTAVSPALDVVAQVMPLHHAVSAMREAVAGRSVLPQLGLELAVGLGWTCVAACLYGFFDRRGRRLGRGAFAA